MALRTRVFELAPDTGYVSLRRLAVAMGIDVSTVSRVRAGLLRINETFIAGALRAFTGKTMDDLFYTEDCEAIARAS